MEHGKCFSTRLLRRSYCQCCPLAAVLPFGCLALSPSLVLYLSPYVSHTAPTDALCVSHCFLVPLTAVMCLSLLLCASHCSRVPYTASIGPLTPFAVPLTAVLCLLLLPLDLTACLCLPLTTSLIDLLPCLMYVFHFGFVSWC